MWVMTFQRPTSVTSFAGAFISPFSFVVLFSWLVSKGYFFSLKSYKLGHTLCHSEETASGTFFFLFHDTKNFFPLRKSSEEILNPALTFLMSRF